MESPETVSIKLLIFTGGVIFFFLWEWFYRYREPTESRARRWLINLSLAGTNALLLSFLFGSTIAATLVFGTQHRMGLFYTLTLPAWIKMLVAILILDFLLYIWHVVNHVVPFFWRFHRVHHSDLNMDVSTATRFHIGELAMSLPIRMVVILLLGVGWQELLVFDSLVLISTQFHHSALRISSGFERIYWLIFVPPSMHRIHHSVVIVERNTNYGAIFSLWDRLCGTLLTTVDQYRIRIGMGAYPRQAELTFWRLLIMPFTRPVK